VPREASADSLTHLWPLLHLSMSFVGAVSLGRSRACVCKHEEETPTVMSQHINKDMSTLQAHTYSRLHKPLPALCSFHSDKDFLKCGNLHISENSLTDYMCRLSYVWRFTVSERLVSQTHTFCFQPHKDRATEEKTKQRLGIIKFVFSEL